MCKKNKKGFTDHAAIWVAMVTAIIAVILSALSLYHSYQLEKDKEKEQLLLSVNRVFNDYPTKIFPFSSRGGSPTGSLSIFWDVLISNNGKSPVSIVDYDISEFNNSGGISKYSGLNGGLFDMELNEIGVPVVIEPGHAKKFFLNSRILLHTKAFQAALGKELEKTFPSINNLTMKLYKAGTDFYGNKVIIPRKNLDYAIVPPQERKEQVFVITLSTAKGSHKQDYVSWYTHSGLNK